MTALHLIYQHWFITCILVTTSTPLAYLTAVSLGGFVLRLRSGK